MRRLSHFQGSLLVLFSGVVFSFGGLAFRQTDDIGAWPYLTFRAAGALVVTLVVFAVQNRGRVGAVAAGIQRSHVLAGIVLGTMFSVFIVALTHTTVAFIVFFQSATPVVAAGFSWWLLRERISSATARAAAVVGVGVVMMVGGNMGSGLTWGAMIAVLIPIGLGLYATLIRGAADIDTSVPVIIASIVAGTAGLVVSLATDALDVSVRDGAIGFLAGAFLLGAALPLYNAGQRVVPAPEATLLLLSEVVLAPVWVWIWADERPTGATIAGGAVILAAVVWLTSQSAGSSRRVVSSRG